MANVSILDLPVAVGLDGTEWAEIVQAGVSRRATTAMIASLATGGGAFAVPIIVTAAGVYTVPDSATWVIINKTDGANVILGALADKVGSVLIVAAQGAAHPFNVVNTDGTIAGSLSSYPFSADYQSVRFAPVVDLNTWAV